MVTRSAAARILKISRDRLSRLEKAGLAHPQRGAHNQPFYSGQEIARLQSAFSSGQLPKSGRLVAHGNVALQGPALPVGQSATQSASTVGAAAQLSAQIASQATAPTGTAQLSAQGAAQVAATITSPAQVIAQGVSVRSVAASASLQALHDALEEERLRRQVLEAGIETMRAQAAHHGVAVALPETVRAQRIVAIIRGVLPRIPEDDRGLAEDVLRERLAGLEDLDRWRPVTDDVCRELDERRARLSIARAREHHERAAERAARAVSAEAAHAAQLVERQAIVAVGAQRAAAAQSRALAVARMVTEQVVTDRTSPEAGPAIHAAVMDALRDLSEHALYDDFRAFRCAWWAVAGLGL